MADRQKRLERIRAAKAALEAEAATEVPRPDGGERPGPSNGMTDQGRPERAGDGGPPDKAQRNFTDPDSRILKTRDGFVQGYNGQFAVDGHRQVITAHRLTTNGADHGALSPLLDDTTRRCGRKPKEISADAGFCNQDNLEARGIAGYLMPGRARHHRPGDTGRRRIAPGSLVARMDAKLRRAGRRSRYRLRKQIVEPVFGQIKAARGFRQFSLRGFDNGRHSDHAGAQRHRHKLVAARREPEASDRLLVLGIACRMKPIRERSSHAAMAVTPISIRSAM